MDEARIYPEGYPEFLIHLHEVEAREASPSFSRSAPRAPIVEFAPEPALAIEERVVPATQARVPISVRRTAPRVPDQGRLL